nr:hypothetical protein GCM10020185_03850 [Pseudomonas brassicacearum subsp. brassicacearum]
MEGAQAIRTWSGTEGYLPDRQPVIGHSSTQPGLLHAFGFAGAGFQIGPAVGQALTEIICSGASTTPLDAFFHHPVSLHLRCLIEEGRANE